MAIIRRKATKVIRNKYFQLKVDETYLQVLEQGLEWAATRTYKNILVGYDPYPDILSKFTTVLRRLQQTMREANIPKLAIPLLEKPDATSRRSVSVQRVPRRRR